MSALRGWLTAPVRSTSARSPRRCRRAASTIRRARVRRPGRPPLRCAREGRARRLAAAPLQPLESRRRRLRGGPDALPSTPATSLAHVHRQRPQPLIDVCQAILEFWHDLIAATARGQLGLAIILLTFTVRLAILPLTFKGVKSMQRLQPLQPEIKKIQERYKDDQQRMNQEVMAFYQREKVNPLGSCLPLLLQIPFFIALFYLLRSPSSRRTSRATRLPGDRQPRREGHRPGAAGRPDRALRGHAAGRQRGHGDQRRPDAAADHVRAAVRLRRSSSSTSRRADRLLDHHERLDDRPAAAREEALSEAGAATRGRAESDGKPARGKPARAAAAAADGRGGEAGRDGKAPKAAPARAATARPTKAPPGSPRKKKKRSGRRR